MATEANIPEDVSATNIGLEGRYSTTAQIDSNPNECSPAESIKPSSGLNQFPQCSESSAEAETKEKEDKMENRAQTQISENERQHQKGVLSKDVETGADKVEAINDINIQETDHDKENDGAKISRPACAEEPNPKVHEEETPIDNNSLDQHLELITDQHASLKVIPESIVNDENTRSKGEEDADLECNEQATSISDTNLGLLNEALLPNLDLKTKSQGEEDERVIESYTKDEDTDTAIHVEDELKEICLAGVQNKKAEIPSVPEGEWKDPESIGPSNKLEHDKNREEDASTANVGQIPHIHSVEESTFEAASKSGDNDNDRSEKQDGGKRDSWQKYEQEVELGEQIILIPEKTEIAASREDAEKRVEQDLHPVEKFEEKEEKDGGETSISTEKSLPLAESITEIKSKETIFIQKIANDLNSEGPLVEETGQPDSGEIGEVSKTEAEEKHQEASKISTENNEQDEHFFETHSTENLVIKHTDSEAMVTTETITKPTKDTEELERVPESRSEEKIDIKGDEKTIPEEPKETEEATDKQSYETAKESASENEAPSRLPTTALISDETIEQSIEEESPEDGESTLVEKNGSHRPENDAEEKKKAVEALDLRKSTGGQNTCKQQIIEGSVDETMNNFQDNEKEIQSSREDTGREIKEENDVPDLPPEFIQQNTGLEERYSTTVQLDSNPKECSPAESEGPVESSPPDKSPAENICRSEHSQADKIETEELTEISENERQDQKGIEIKDVETGGDKVEAINDINIEEPDHDIENNGAKISMSVAEEPNLEVYEEETSTEISSLDQHLELITDQHTSFKVIPESIVKDENTRLKEEEDADLEYNEQATSISKANLGLVNEALLPNPDLKTKSQDEEDERVIKSSIKDEDTDTTVHMEDELKEICLAGVQNQKAQRPSVLEGEWKDPELVGSSDKLEHENNREDQRVEESIFEAASRNGDNDNDRSENQSSNLVTDGAKTQVAIEAGETLQEASYMACKDENKDIYESEWQEIEVPPVDRMVKAEDSARLNRDVRGTHEEGLTESNEDGKINPEKQDGEKRHSWQKNEQEDELDEQVSLIPEKTEIAAPRENAEKRVEQNLHPAENFDEKKEKDEPASTLDTRETSISTEKSLPLVESITKIKSEETIFSQKIPDDLNSKDPLVEETGQPDRGEIGEVSQTEAQEKHQESSTISIENDKRDEHRSKTQSTENLIIKHMDSEAITKTIAKSTNDTEELEKVPESNSGDSARLDRDLRGANEEDIIQTGLTETDEDGKINPETHDGGKRDSWQKNEQEVELEEQKILIPEKTEIAAPRENAENGVEQNIELSEKFEETEEKDEPTSTHDTDETSISTEKNLPLAKSTTDIRSEEMIFPRKIADDLNSEGPLVEETGQPHSGEIGEVSKTEAQEKHQDSSKFSTENNKQDEHCSETLSTESLVIKHTDSEAMVTTETNTKPIEDTGELDKVPEPHLEEKIDIKGDENIIPEQPKGTEEATDKQSHETAKESVSEDEAPSRLPTTAMLRDETVEHSTKEESLRDGELTLVEKNDSHRPENDDEEKKTAVEAFDPPKSTGGLDTCKQQIIEGSVDETTNNFQGNEKEILSSREDTGREIKAENYVPDLPPEFTQNSELEERHSSTVQLESNAKECSPAESESSVEASSQDKSLTENTCTSEHCWADKIENEELTGISESERQNQKGVLSKDVETGGDKVEVIDDINIEEPDHDIENDVAKISTLTCAEEPNLKVHEEETTSSLDQHLELITDQHASFKVFPESIVNDENTRSKGEEDADLECNEQATSISETNLSKINEASLTNLDLTTKSLGEEDVSVIESCTKEEDMDTTIHVEDDFKETSLTGVQNKKEEISSAFEKDPESIRSSSKLEHDNNREEDASIHRVEEYTFGAASRNGDNYDDKSENPSLNLVADGTSTQVAIEPGETLQEASYSACKDKNKDIYESIWQEIDVPPAEDSVCLNRDLRGANEEEITQTGLTETNEDGRINPETHDGEKRDSWQKNEQEVELKEIILTPEKTEIAAPRENAEKGVEQNIQNLEKFQEREEKDEPTSTPDTTETSISTEKSFPLVESITKTKSEELNSNYLLVEEAGQLDSGETGKVSKTDSEEKHQESSKFSAENNKQDEHHSETQSTENLVIKHTDSEAMVTTETITKSTKDTEELEKVTESHSEEKIDIKGDETIIPEEPKEMEEATDKQSHKTAQESVSEDEAPSRLPTPESIRDETVEQSFQEESLKDGESTLIEKNESHRPENDAEENIKAVKAFDLPKTTAGEDTSKQQIIEGSVEETINNFQDNEKEIQSSREETERGINGKNYVPDLPPEFIKQNTELEYLTTAQLDSSPNECSSAESKKSVESSCPDKSPIENICTSEHFQADKIEDQAPTKLSENESQHQEGVPSEDVETGSNKVEAITDKSIEQDHEHDIENGGAKIPRLACAEEPNPKVHEEQTSIDNISLDQHLELITDQHAFSTVIAESVEKEMITPHTNENTRSKGEEDTDLECNEQVTSISETKLGLVNEALLPNLDLKTKSQGEEVIESCTKDEDADTAIHVEDEFNELCLAGVQNKKAEMPSVSEGEWKDPESIRSSDKLEHEDNREEDVSKLNVAQSPYVHSIEESTIEAASKNGDKDDDKSENPSSNLVIDEASTQVALEAAETLQEASYTACEDKNKDIHESVWKEVDVPSVDRMAKAEDSTCLNSDVRRTNEEEIIQMGLTESNEDSKINPEKHDGEKRDSWQKDEQEDELGEQVILIPEKTEIASQTEVAEQRVEQNIHPAENFDEKEEKNEPTFTPDTGETSISTEKSLSPVESITKIKNEESISPQITANGLNSTYPLVEGTGQPDSSETDEVSKTEAEEKHQESSKFSTEYNKQDEHYSETQNTENLVIKHTDSEAMVTTETITKSTKDTEELEKVTESHSEEKTDIKGDEIIIPEEPKEMEEATDKQSNKTAKESVSEDKAPSRLPTLASVRDETVEQSFQKGSLKDDESTLIEKNKSHRPEIDAEEEPKDIDDTKENKASYQEVPVTTASSQETIENLLKVCEPSETEASVSKPEEEMENTVGTISSASVGMKTGKENLEEDESEETKMKEEVHQRLGTAHNNENIKEHPTEGRITSPEEETGNEVEVSTSEFMERIESTKLAEEKKSLTLEDHTEQNMDITDFSALESTHASETCTEVSSSTSKVYEKETEAGFIKKDDPSTDDPKNVPVIVEIEEIGLKNAGPGHVEYDKGSDVAIESKGETAIATDKTTSDHIDITEREEENSKPEKKGILEESNEGHLKMDSYAEETEKTTTVQHERELATSSIPISQDYPKPLVEGKDAMGSAAIYPEDGRSIREEITDETSETYLVHASENTSLQKEHEVVKLGGVSELASVNITNESSNEVSPKLENEGLHMVFDQKTNNSISDTSSIAHQDDSCKLHTEKEEMFFVEASKCTVSSTYKDSEAMQGQENLATNFEGSLTSVAEEKTAASETRDFTHENEPADEFPSEKTVEAADTSEKIELATESMAKDQSDEKIYQAEEKSNSEDHIFEPRENVPGQEFQGEINTEVNMQFEVEHLTSASINAHEASVTGGCTENVLDETEKANGSENILEDIPEPKSNLKEADTLSAGYETANEASATNSGFIEQTEKMDLMDERESRILENLAKANDNFSSLTAIAASEEGIHKEESEKTLFRKSPMGSQGVEKDSKAEIFNKEEVTNIFETLPCMPERKDVTTTDKAKTRLDTIDTDNIQEESSNSEDSGDKQSPEIVVEGGREMDQDTRDKDPKSGDDHEKEEDNSLTLIPKNNLQNPSVMRTEDGPHRNKFSNSIVASDDQTCHSAETTFVVDAAEKKLPQSNHDVIKPKVSPEVEIAATEKENANKEIQKQEDEDLRDLNSQETISDTKDIKISRAEKGSGVTDQNGPGTQEEVKDQKPCIEGSKYTLDATSTNDEQEAENFRSSSKVIVAEKIETESEPGGQSIIRKSTNTEKSELQAEKILESDNLDKFESASNEVLEKGRDPDVVLQIEAHEKGEEEYIDSLKEGEEITKATASDEPGNLKTIERAFEFVPEVHNYEVLAELEDKEKHIKTALTKLQPEENQFKITTAAGKTINTQVSDEKIKEEQEAAKDFQQIYVGERDRTSDQETEQSAIEYPIKKTNETFQTISNDNQHEVKSEAIEKRDHENIKDDLPDDLEGTKVTEAAKSVTPENRGTETKITSRRTEVVAQGEKEQGVTVDITQKGHMDTAEVSEYTQEIQKLDDSSWETVDINLIVKADVETRKTNDEDVQQRPQNSDGETIREVQAENAKPIDARVEGTEVEENISSSNILKRSTEEPLQAATHLDEATAKTHQAETPEFGEAKKDSEKDDGEYENRKIEPLSGPSPMVETSTDRDVKVARKKSHHSILSGVGSKVKHSISKVKKAITGKSSHPKTTSPK